MDNGGAKQVVVISTGTIVRVVLVVLAFYALYLLKDLLLVILTAVVIGSAVEPATQWFAKYKIGRIPAVLIVYVGTFLLLGGIIYIFVPPLITDLTGLAGTLPEKIRSSDLWGSAGQFTELTNRFEITLLAMAKQFGSIASSLPSGLFTTTSFIFGGVFSFVLILVLSFYLAVQERGIENLLRIIVPLKQEAYILDLWRRSQKKIGLWMQGQMLLGLLIGVLVYLGLTVLQVKYALVLALLAVVFELIPVFGPILAAVPAVLFGFSDNATLGLMVLGFYVIVQQFENHLIYPLVVKKIVGVPPLVAIIALIVGGTLAGFLGILIAAPVAAVVMEWANDLEKRKASLGSNG